ncbi:MAG: endonuclease [Anaerolineales bacterium]
MICFGLGWLQRRKSSYEKKWLSYAGRGDGPMTIEPNRYSKIIHAIFAQKYRKGAEEIVFERADFATAAAKLGIALPKNLGDILYSFRYRQTLPTQIVGKAPQGKAWLIRPAGRARYKFVLVDIRQTEIIPSLVLAETKIPDATPGLVKQYALDDEQALLSMLRYNRLIDIFTGLTCYSLQNHLRTTVPEVGQIETDEIYVGVDRRGVHYIIPVQAKRKKDRIGIVQIEQDMLACSKKYPGLVCRPIAAQLMANNVIALFEFEQNQDGVRVFLERHYRLVSPDELSPDELATYHSRTP